MANKKDIERLETRIKGLRNQLDIVGSLAIIIMILLSLVIWGYHYESKNNKELYKALNESNNLYVKQLGLSKELAFANNSSEVLEAFEILKQLNHDNIADALMWKDKYLVCDANLNSLKQFELTPLEIEGRHDVTPVTCLYGVKMWDDLAQLFIDTNSYELTTDCYLVSEE